MKHEWRKKEKALYLPKTEPMYLQVPPLKYFVLEGEGNPNDPFFGEYIAALYTLSYGVRMSHKSGIAPEGYQEYTVYPLTGIWDLNDTAKAKGGTGFSKDDLIFRLMIRQPDFVTEDFAETIRGLCQKKKPHPLLEKATFETIEDGPSVQMMHVGPYDDEPASFAKMETWAEEQGLKRLSKVHREIYLSDFRKVAPEKLKTVLRFQVKG